MLTDPWTLLDALMSRVINPMAAALWVHNFRLGTHDREVLHILALLFERKDQRDENRAELKDALQGWRIARSRFLPRRQFDLCGSCAQLRSRQALQLPCGTL